MQLPVEFRRKQRGKRFKIMLPISQYSFLYHFLFYNFFSLLLRMNLNEVEDTETTETKTPDLMNLICELYDLV